MSKLTIEGRHIGTTAENVGYTNSDMNGVTHAKGALDNLNTRMKAVEQGGSTPTPVESAADVPYSKQGWTGVANVKQALDDVQDRLRIADTLVENGGITSEAMLNDMYYNANTTQLAVGQTFVENPWNGASGAKMAIKEGERLRFKGIGWWRHVLDNVYGYVFVDGENKILAIGAKAASEASPTVDGYVDAPAGSRYVYISGYKDYFPRAWIEYTDRPHLKGRKLLQCYGDSIMTYDISNDRFYTYPLILAAKLGAKLSRFSMGGAQIPILNTWIRQSRCDADVYLNALGYNSINNVADYDDGGAASVGSATAALEILPADGSFRDLTSAQVTELTSTAIGKYWYYQNMMIDFNVNPNAQFVCVGFYGLRTDSETNTAAKDFRAELENLVDGISNEHPNVHYINGKKYVLDYSAYFYADSVHPNQKGQVAIAEGLYPYIADLLGKIDVYYDNNPSLEW